MFYVCVRKFDVTGTAEFFWKRTGSNMRARTKPKDLAYKLTQIGSTVNPSLICVHPKASWSVPGKVVAEILFASFLWIHVPDGY